MADVEELSTLFSALDSSSLISELPILAGATLNLIELSSEQGLKDSQVMIYMSFLHYIHTIPDREHSQKVLSHFIKIPKKKKHNYESEETKQWIEIHVAKNFYTPISKMINKEFVKDWDNDVPMYYAMAHYFMSYFSRFTNEELLEKYNGLMSIKNFNEMARMNMSLFLYVKDNDVIELSLTNMKNANLFHTFSYYLNEVIKQSYLHLLKYGRKESIVSLADNHFELANQIISEDINRALQEKQEYESITKEYEKTINQLDKDIESFKLKSNILALENNKLERMPLLTGFSILIIGDEKNKIYYEELINEYGASEVFVLNGLDKVFKVRELALENDITYAFDAYTNNQTIHQLIGLDNIIPVSRIHLSTLDYQITQTYEILRNKSNKGVSQNAGF